MIIRVPVKRLNVSRRRIQMFLVLVSIFGLTAMFAENHYTNRISIEKYHVPDVDGTNTSCRCGKGPQMYIWPPPNGPQDLLCPDSTYDLTVCVRVDHSKPPRKTLLQERLQQLLNNTKDVVKKLDDFEGLTEDGKDLLVWYQLEGFKNTGDQENYNMYPMAINISETIQALNAGSAAPFAPITNPNIKLLRVPTTACSPDDSKSKIYDLIIIYKTAVFNFEDRRRIREATKNMPSSIRVVFTIGQPRTDNGGRLFHMNGGFEIQLPERAGLAAEKWANRTEEAKRLVFEEAKKYGDLIIGDYEDTYVNLTYKLITSHRWASVFCQGRADMFLIMDDDYEINPDNMLRYLKSFSRKERRQIISGSKMVWRYVVRPRKDNRRNKWALTHHEVPWPRLPSYVAGAACLIGADVLDELVISEIYTRFLWVDDAYLGFVMAKLPSRQFEEMKGYYMESSNNYKALVYHRPFQLSTGWFLDTIRQVLNAL